MKECSGAEKSMGKRESLAACADACRWKTSMFIYGTNEYNEARCEGNKCQCYCETDSHEEECTGTLQENKGYNLYAFHTPGGCIGISNVSIFINILLSLK